MAWLHAPVGTAGFRLLCPIQAVVSSQEQTGSVLGTVIDSPESVTLVSGVERERWLEELTPGQGEFSWVSAFPMPLSVQSTQKGDFYALCSFELFIPRFSLYLTREFIHPQVGDGNVN